MKMELDKFHNKTIFSKFLKLIYLTFLKVQYGIKTIFFPVDTLSDILTGSVFIYAISMTPLQGPA